MTRGKLTQEEIQYVEQQIEEAKANMIEGSKAEETFELYENLTIHCHENIFDREAARLKQDLKSYMIRYLHL
jgi:sRNA-binding protein